ncbi:hypothetical protein EDC01DRAFT_669805 [Geopyxis carbonaria]|nr:hypothetical protein EDC01DRAFT_669805 [Geopyxis carbonaria]
MFAPLFRALPTAARTTSTSTRTLRLHIRTMTTSAAAPTPAPFSDADAAAVHRFWFTSCPLSPTAAIPPEAMSRWFRASDEFDAACTQFGPLATALATTHTPASIVALATTPRRALALTLLLDQIPRNLHRADSRAVYSVFDPLACAVAAHAVAPERRLDLGCTQGGVLERFWFILPFMHSEERALHTRAVELAEELVAGASEEQRGAAEYCLRFEKEHQDVVERWGRYPYRNKTMGREDTPEEKEWLAGEGVPEWARST